MDQFLNSLPRWALVGGSLAIGLFLILLFNPPHTACDSQFEIFQKSETPFLYKDAAKKFDLDTGYEKTKKMCAENRLPGSCFQFFEGIRLLVKDLKTISLECRPKISARSEVSNALWDGLGFIFELAWGTTPPKSYYDKAGWLDSTHMTIFCDLQKFVQDSFSQDDWVQFREKTLTSLPGANTIGRAEAWNRSLFTLKCQM